jgi:hypothetical protein
MTPSRFKEELKHFDRCLDLKYNGAKARWEIWGTSLQHKQYLIKTFALGQIATMGLDTIREMAEVSPVKKTAKEINARIDRIIEEEEKQEEKSLKNSIQDHLDEAWERYQYAEGSRISFARIDHKVDDKSSFTITDKRRFQDTAAIGESNGN